MDILHACIFIIVGLLLGSFFTYAVNHSHNLKVRRDYTAAKLGLLDTRKELLDANTEAMQISASVIADVYKARQEDVTVFTQGTHAALQLINDLMAHANSAISSENPVAVHTHMQRAHDAANEMRKLLDEVRYADLQAVLERHAEAERKATELHNRIAEATKKLYTKG